MVMAVELIAKHTFVYAFYHLVITKSINPAGKAVVEVANLLKVKEQIYKMKVWLAFYDNKR